MSESIRPIAVDEDKAAIVIDVPVSSLQKMRGQGTGPAFVKIGNRVRYRVEDLESYIAERVVHSTSEPARAA